MKENYDRNMRLRCVVCGNDNSFESNDDYKKDNSREQVLNI